jgi:hypothetical protein
VAGILVPSEGKEMRPLVCSSEGTAVHPLLSAEPLERLPAPGKIKLKKQKQNPNMQNKTQEIKKKFVSEAGYQ